MLEAAGLRFSVRPVDIEEVARPGEEALDFACRMAREKAAAGEGEWVLASDTIVTVDGRPLGKPKDDEDAARILRLLSGREHAVITAWALEGAERRQGHETTHVRFETLSEQAIADYVASGEPRDKAGAYGIQGGAGRFIAGVRGPYDNVVGLPLGQVLPALIDSGAIAPFPSALALRAAGLRARIAAAAQAAERDPSEVTLIGVGKRHPADRLREALAAGVTSLGESYVQELLEKQRSVECADWHFVGRVQRNKAKQLVGRASLIHGVGAARTADALDKAARARGLEVAVLVQVNLAAEESKSGVHPEDLSPLLQHVESLPGLRLRGLMALPPAGSLGAARSWFAQLRTLRDAQPQALPELSMGMSGDFDAAVAEGATLVRVGTALFGPRPV